MSEQAGRVWRGREKQVPDRKGATWRAGNAAASQRWRRRRWVGRQVGFRRLVAGKASRWSGAWQSKKLAGKQVRSGAEHKETKEKKDIWVRPWNTISKKPECKLLDWWNNLMSWWTAGVLADWQQGFERQRGRRKSAMRTCAGKGRKNEEKGKTQGQSSV